MRDYRFYWLKPDGRIDTAANLEFADDQAARNHAQSVANGYAMEVWQAARLVFCLGQPARVAG